MKAPWEFVKALWITMNSPDNDSVVVGLLLGMVALLVAHVMVRNQFKARLKDKDQTIADLTEQRNKWQGEYLKLVGQSRKSSRSTKD